ncbi:hypothetical protein DAPPUDRAFT_330294 [Daphnia pulex]|uniref:Uncharacterized protein n=1 Tax=Daphnia pulex TaxID=6669 RepID=E9HJ51_DAPPU|nr:hypothetical protein DAPPUDRAFT_330294 [Daphnia pulex]|eukprot:EFX68230.1 hypothetical protein DAPPUDRAFT_330294 [Daphnia pulex]
MEKGLFRTLNQFFITIVSECRLDNCFWLPAILLQNFIKKCENIEVLKISETKLSCANLAHIFGKCKKISDLSLTLSTGDLKLTGPKLASNTILQSCLKDCCDNLKNLLKLELVMFCSSLKEMTIFLSICDNLKELVLIPVKDQNLIAHQAIELSSEIEGNFILDSLIVVNLEDDLGLLYPFLRQLPFQRYQDYIVFKIDMSNLKNHWNDASPCPVIKDKFSALTFKHLKIRREMFEFWWIEKNFRYPPTFWLHNGLVVDGWYVNDPLKNIDLNHIRSVREPLPIFIQKGLKAPLAKMISCFYSNEGFSDFCQNHPHLKVLKLQAPPVHDELGNALCGVKNQVVGEEWNSNSWENLSELEVLSIEPSLLIIEQKPGQRPVKKRRFGEPNISKAAEFNPHRELHLLDTVINSCSRIQELEIGMFIDLIDERIGRIEDLSNISQCKLLKKLTLANFNITDGVFLEEVLKVKESWITTSMLLHKKPVRISSQRKKTEHIKRNMVPLAKLLDSIEQCPALIRLGLVVPSDEAPFKWTSEVLTHRMVTLCVKLQYLVAFFCVVNIPKSHKAKVLKQILQVVTPKRPSFSVDIQASHRLSWEYESSTLPVLHREILVHCNSRVCVVPYDYKSSLL